MLAHRNDEYLREALRSIKEQTFQDFEVIVVANGPEAAAVKQTVDSIGFRNSNSILADAGSIGDLANIGIQNARGSLIARFDSDDVSMPKRLEIQADFMARNPKVDIIGAQALVIDQFGKESGRLSRPVDHESIKCQMPFRCPLIQPSVMMRKEAVLAAGGYQAGSNAEDWDLWIRLMFVQRSRFANLPEDLIAYRIHGLQTTGRKFKQLLGEIQVLWHGLLGRYSWRFIPGLLLRLVVGVLPTSLLTDARRIFGRWQRSKVLRG